jgi:hemoglobin-like flavoprotein
LNPTQQELIRSTFDAVAVMPEVAGALFYERLFEEHPEFRPLFKGDMRAQGVKLVTMLSMVVDHIDRPESLLQTLHELGARHVDYGVKMADYPAVRNALVWMLAQALGDRLTPAAGDAWIQCYDGLAQIMTDQARAMPAAAKAMTLERKALASDR